MFSQPKRICEAKFCHHFRSLDCLWLLLWTFSDVVPIEMLIIYIQCAIFKLKYRFDKWYTQYKCVFVYHLNDRVKCFSIDIVKIFILQWTVSRASVSRLFFKFCSLVKTSADKVTQARIQEFTTGGPTFRKKYWQAKKKTITHKGEGGVFCIYSALVPSKSNLAVESAFQTIIS